MRWADLLRALRSRLFPRGAAAPPAAGRGGEAEDATVAVRASQAVTVATEHRPWDRSPDPRSRKPLPWPARDVSRSLRPSEAEDAAAPPAPSSAGGPDTDDVTVVVPHPAGDDARVDPDVTVVWPKGDETRRRDA